MNEDIYKMELHETINLPNKGMQITRVPSGWIYELVAYNGYVGGTVFVPFDNHFMQ